MAQTPEVQIGHSIRAFRKRAKNSIVELGELSGLDPSYLNHLELGKVNPSLSTLVKIARALKVEVADLLGPVGGEKEDEDYQIFQALRVLLIRHKPNQKSAILSVLKALRNPKRLEAFQQLIRK